LLHEALKRAESVASHERVLAVVSQQHRRWWGLGLSGLPKANIIVQPRNCGTANGVLLPLLYIVTRDPEARVVLLPSDHHVRDEQVLATSLQCAAQEVSTRRDDILLLGILPEEADPDLGYIVPGRLDGAVSMVDRFVEKPDRSAARTLLERYCNYLFSDFRKWSSTCSASSLRTNSLPVSRPRRWISIAICPTSISPAKSCRELNRCCEYCVYRAAGGAILGPRSGLPKLCKPSRILASVQMMHRVGRADS
jgi:hypothetical protein